MSSANDNTSANLYAAPPDSPPPSIMQNPQLPADNTPPIDELADYEFYEALEQAVAARSAPVAEHDEEAQRARSPEPTTLEEWKAKAEAERAKFNREREGSIWLYTQLNTSIADEASLRTDRDKHQEEAARLRRLRDTYRNAYREAWDQLEQSKEDKENLDEELRLAHNKLANLERNLEKQKKATDKARARALPPPAPKGLGMFDLPAMAALPAPAAASVLAPAAAPAPVPALAPAPAPTPAHTPATTPAPDPAAAPALSIPVPSAISIAPVPSPQDDANALALANLRREHRKLKRSFADLEESIRFGARAENVIMLGGRYPGRKRARGL